MQQAVKIRLCDVFNLVSLSMAIIEHGRAIDEWREPTGAKPLLSCNHILSGEGTKPITKPDGHNVGDKDGLWGLFHNQIMLPFIRRLKDFSELSQLQDHFLSDGDLDRTMIRYHRIRTHIDQIEETQEALTNFDLVVKEDWHDLEEPYRTLLENEIKTNANHLLGRVLQAYYAEKTGKYAALGLPMETPHYFYGGKKNVFERTFEYAQNQIPKCPLRGKEEINLGDALSFYVWLARPYVVEMITPYFLGAASRAAEKITHLTELIYLKTNGEVDLRYVEIPEQTLLAIRSNQTTLRKIFAAEQFFDAHPQLVENAAITMREFRKNVWEEGLRA